MAIEIFGKLILKQPVQSGTSAKGAWEKQEFVIETAETYPRKVCISLWGSDKVAELNGYNIGDSLKISINIESREYNGRWYTDVRAWRMEKAVAGSTESAPFTNSSSSASPNNIDTNEYSEENSADDLPF